MPLDARFRAKDFLANTIPVRRAFEVSEAAILTPSSHGSTLPSLIFVVTISYADLTAITVVRSCSDRSEGARKKVL